MAEYYGSGGISMGVPEGLVGERYEPGDGIQGLEPKRPKIGMHTNVRRGTSPLGLTLTKTPSFVKLIETKLSKHSEQKTRKHKPQSPDEKMKPSNIPAISLQIGSWKRVASYDSDVVVKCYYAKQKLVWEVLCEGLKSKMEIQWLQISAIRATFVEGHPDILEIELHKPPTYFCESPPQPRKHTMWIAGDDITGGQAQIYMKHLLEFAEGTLEKHYEKLLQCDSRLYQLCRRPFFNTSSPLFDIIPVKQQANQYYSQSGIVFQPQQFLHQIPDVGTLCNINTPSQHFTPYQSISSSINSINSFYSFPLQTMASSAMNSRHTNKDLSVLDPRPSPAVKNFVPVNIDDIPVWNQENPSVQLNQQALEINSIMHQLLSEPQSPVFADEKSLLVKVSSFRSVLCELNQVAQVASRGEDDPNATVAPEFYNQIGEQADGIYSLSDSSSSMVPRVYSDGYMFRPR